LYLVERERQVSLGATLLRRRARTFLTLSLGGSRVWEDLSLLEEDLTESTRFRLTRPKASMADGWLSLSASSARSYPFSISPEEGASGLLRGRIRTHLNLADSLAGAEGFDRSFSEVLAQLRLYKGIRGPGFSNHVLAFRASGGLAGGPGADQGHFEVGGASGGSLPLAVGFLRGEGRFFPVRGYGTTARFGRYAWTLTAEYRFPLRMINRGSGLFPLHLDWVSGALFLDAGNAWGPDLGLPGYENPRGDALASVGGEVTVRMLPLWFTALDLRFGVALPLVRPYPEAENNPRGYVRIGPAF
jgi:hypothetical protein